MSGELVTPGAAGWPQALSGLEHDVYHRPEWSRIESSRQPGSRPQAFIYRRGGGVFLLPLLIRPIPGEDKVDAISPYGYPGPLVSAAAGESFVRSACEELAEALRDAGVVTAFVRMHPILNRAPEPLASVGKLVRHGETVAVDLALSRHELARQLRSGHRSEIERARREGFVVERDRGWRELAAFAEIYRMTMERVGADPEYLFGRRYFERLRDALGDCLSLFVVRREGVITAASLISRVGPVVQYHLSGTHDDYLRQRPGKLLLAEVTTWAKSEGARWFHLGGGVGGRADSLFRFKSGFGRLRFDFHTWRLVTDRPAYADLCHPRGADAADGTGFFPAYRAPASG